MKIKLSDIRYKFGKGNEPKDEKLLELLGSAYKGDLLCRVALIKIEGIKTFSDFIPKISAAYVRRFQEITKKGDLPQIYVYPEDGKFVMSDDYRTYHLYLITGHKKIMCVVLGEAEGNYVIEKSEPFRLPPPSIEVIKNYES